MNRASLGEILLLPLLMVGLPLATLLFYPAVLLAAYAYAYVLRGGQDVVWYLNLTLITLVLTCASVGLYLLRERRMLFRPCIYDYLVLLLVVLLLVGSLYTPDPMMGLAKTGRFAALVVLPYFLARVILVTPGRFHLLASAILYLAVALAGVMVITHLAPGVVPQFLNSEHTASSRAQFLDANQVPLATFLAIGTILAFVKKKQHGALLTLPAIALLLYATLLTGTRSPILALGVVGILYLASIFVRSPSRAMLVTLIVALGFTVLVSSGLYQSLPNWNRFEVAATDRDVDPSIQSRHYLADQAIVMFLDNPLTGGGTASLSGYPHNIFLELGAENGLVGVAVMVTLILLVARCTWIYLFRSRRLDDNVRTVAFLVLFPFIALLVIKQFSFDLTMHKDLFIFLAAVVNLSQFVSPAPKAQRPLLVSTAHQAPSVATEAQPHTEEGLDRRPNTGVLSRNQVTEAN
jgi:O-antigen ligase